MADATALRVGRRMVRRLLRDQCQVYRQAVNAADRTFLHTLPCSVHGDTDPTPLPEDPGDATEREVADVRIHFRYNADVARDDLVIHVEQSQEWHVGDVFVGTYSGTKVARGTFAVYSGRLITLVLFYDPGTGGNKVARAAQRVRRVVDDPPPEEVTTMVSRSRIRTGWFVKAAPFAVEVGDTYVSPEGVPGRIIDVRPGQRAFVEARFQEPS